MTSKDESSGAILVVAALITLAYFAFIAIYVIAVVAAFVLSILSLCAWRRPISVLGMDIDPREAQTFVWGGITLAGLVPAILVLLSLLFNVVVSDKYFFHFLAGGYTIGAFLAVAALEAQRRKEREAASMVVRHDGPTIDVSKAPAPEPFRFASWEDEEKRP